MKRCEPTEFVGKVVWLGHVKDRDASLLASPLERMDVVFEGTAGESHAGLTRPACVRVSKQYPEGLTIRNVRQFSVLSQEEIDVIGAELDIENLSPTLFGANIVIAGIPDFTLIPPSSRLQFSSGATLAVDMENRPCNLVTREITKAHDGRGKAFKAAAINRRGVTAWTEAEGPISLGDSVRLHIPSQDPWPHHRAAIAQMR